MGLGWKRLKDHLIPPSCHERDTFTSPGAHHLQLFSFSSSLDLELEDSCAQGEVLGCSQGV